MPTPQPPLPPVRTIDPAEVQVCTACGYNNIGPHEPACPFCGATTAAFLSAVEASAQFHVDVTPVAPGVDRLRTVPRLGLEHAAHALTTEFGPLWIDCPAVYDPALPPPRAILFTHKDFLGAAPLYHARAKAEIWLHAADAALPIVARHLVDHPFTADFTLGPVRAWCTPGHSPGYTVYRYRNTLLAGDLFFFRLPPLRLNPFGPHRAEMDAARQLRDRLDADIAAGAAIDTICGWNYASAYAPWRAALEVLLDRRVKHPDEKAATDPAHQKYICPTCGLVYDPALGDPEGGIPPGTPFAAIADDWVCPDCGVAKKDFKPLGHPVGHLA